VEGFNASTRRAIRKAERSGVTIRPLEGAEGITAFHGLHVVLRKQKYRLLAQPLAFFQAISRSFREVGGWFPLGAFLGGKLIAATIYLRWADTLYYKFNASSPDSLSARPNTLLVSAGIRLAKSLGCQNLDLGPSDDNQLGLIRFKRQFGARERELRSLRYVPPGWRDEHAAVRESLAEVTRVATSRGVPDEVTRDAGALLYRLFA
jgi:lipid II:glycine glycyltransferase (peptidoglycan interpeptide bridge formation enzyme)